MKKFFEYFAFAFAFVFGASAVFVLAALWFHIDVFGMFVVSATRLVGVFGDSFPIISTRYGEVQIKSKKTAKGQAIEIGCAQCRLEHKLLAPGPFTTSSGTVEGIFQKKHFTGEARFDEVLVNLNADWSDNNVAGSFSLPETDIRNLYHAIRSIVPEAEKAQIKGRVKGDGRFSWPDFYFFFRPKIQGFSVDGLVEDATYKKGEFSYPGKDAAGEPTQIESGEGSKGWTPLSEISRYLPSAVMAVEDRGFYQHPGYDLRSIIDATTHNKRSGAVKRGGSTLTQQLVKNLILSDERTYARKVRELLYAVEIDRELGKRRIMELYLNIVEWGPGIYGVKAAAGKYFGKAPAELLPEQAAWLANILRSPKRAYEKQFLQRKPQSAMIDFVLGHMEVLSEAERQAATTRPLVFIQ